MQCKTFLWILSTLCVFGPIQSILAQAGCDVTVEAGEDVTLCEPNQTINLSAQIAGDFLDVLWEPASGLSAPTAATTQANINNTITYMVKVRSRSSVNLITNGDFSQGDTGFTSNYEYGTGGSFGLLSTEGQYAIDDNPEDTHRRFASCSDHTSGNGNMMVVNASGQEDEFWCQSVSVDAGITYDFSAWITSVNDENPAKLQFSIDGTLLGNLFNSSGNTCIWEEFSAQWVAPASATIEICVVNVNLTPAGNDFAIDDIAFQEICETTDSITITVADLNADWTPPTSICQNDDIILLNDLLQATATPGGIWTLDGQEVASLDPSKLVAGTYTINYTVSQETCVENNEQTVTVQQAPYAGAPGPTLRYCAGTQTTILLADQLEGEDVGGIWTESSLVNSAAGSFDPNTASLQIDGLTAGTYTFNYAVGANGPCDISENEVRVIVDPLPMVDLGTDRALDCIDSTLTLSLSSGVNPEYAFAWTDDSGNSLGTGPELLVDAAGTYQLQVTDQITTCQNQGSVSITDARNDISASATVVPPTCYDSDDGQILVASPSGGSEPYMFSINNGPFGNSSNFANLQPGNYTLTIMDIGGCMETLEVGLTAPSELEVVLLANDLSINLGDSLQIEAVINRRVSQITWTPEQPNCANCNSISVSPVQSTTYFVEVVDEFGCSANAQIEVQVTRNVNIFIPSAFSPNQDGVNDLFFVNAAEGIEIAHMEIADRWGNLVFQRKNFIPNDPGAAWDGYFRGKLVPSGVVVYALEAQLPNGEMVVLSGEIAVVY